MRCTNNGVCFQQIFLLFLTVLGNREINQLQETKSIHHKILWFDISNNDGFLMQIFQHYDDISSIEFTIIGGQKSYEFHNTV